MTNFRILAQSYTSTHRIAKVVAAKTADEALRSVSKELDDAGFYALQATAQ